MSAGSIILVMPKPAAALKAILLFNLMSLGLRLSKSLKNKTNPSFYSGYILHFIEDKISRTILMLRALVNILLNRADLSSIS